MARTPRPSVSKRVRFEVFKRDSFTCQYCGISTRDSSVLLVVDHVVPVVEGGTSAIENLVTACEPCNQGKGPRLLEVAPQFSSMPDAIAEARQSIAEMEEFARLQALLREKRSVVVETIQNTFAEHLNASWVPGEHLLNQMLSTYDPDVVNEAVIGLARAMDRRMVPGRASGDGNSWVKYLWGVARNIDQQRGEG